MGGFALEGAPRIFTCLYVIQFKFPPPLSSAFFSCGSSRFILPFCFIRAKPFGKKPKTNKSYPLWRYSARTHKQPFKPEWRCLVMQTFTGGRSVSMTTVVTWSKKRVISSSISSFGRGNPTYALATPLVTAALPAASHFDRFDRLDRLAYLPPHCCCIRNNCWNHCQSYAASQQEVPHFWRPC